MGLSSAQEAKQSEGLEKALRERAASRTGVAQLGKWGAKGAEPQPLHVALATYMDDRRSLNTIP